MSNWAASATEDVGALAGITLSLFVLLLVFLVGAGWALPRLARGGVSHMAKQMLPIIRA